MASTIDLSKTEKLSRETIDSYIDILLKNFTCKSLDMSKILTLFEAGKYAACISEIGKTIGISNKIEAKCYNDKYFDTTFSKQGNAHVHLPCIPGTDLLPIYGSSDFERLIVRINMRKVVLTNGHAFTYVIAHELCHIILYSTHSSLRSSEIATDLLALIFGFGNTYREAQKFYRETWNMQTGYLINDSLEYASAALVCKSQLVPKVIYLGAGNSS